MKEREKNKMEILIIFLIFWKLKQVFEKYSFFKNQKKQEEKI